MLFFFSSKQETVVFLGADKQRTVLELFVRTFPCDSHFPEEFSYFRQMIDKTVKKALLKEVEGIW